MTLVSAMTAVLSYLAMKWIGLGQPAFWAFVIFALNFIPNIGSILGTLLPCTYALIQFQALQPTFALLIVLGTVQFILGNVVQPRSGRPLPEHEPVGGDPFSLCMGCDMGYRPACSLPCR